MNSVIIIKLILYSIYFCYSLETVNKTDVCPESDVVIRQKRGQLQKQNKSNNDSIKLRFDLNNIGRRVPQHRPVVLYKPLPNLRPKSGLSDRIKVINKAPNQPLACQCPQQNKIPAHPKAEEEKKIAPTTVKNDTTCAEVKVTNNTKDNKTVFFTEHDSEDEFFEEPDQDTTKLPIANNDKNTFSTKINDACANSKKSKDDVIIGVMKELPSIIKTVMTETLKCEGNPVIIKNITEVTLPIYRGSDNSIYDISQKDGQADENSRKQSSRYNKELVDLLLKPILKATKHNTVLSSEDSNEPFETIKIKQHNYSEVVQQNCEPPLLQTEEGEQTPEPGPANEYSFSPEKLDTNHKTPNTYKNMYYAGSYSIPDVQGITASTYPCMYGSEQPYPPPVSVYSSTYQYNPYGRYMKSPYQYNNIHSIMSPSQHCTPHLQSVMSPPQNVVPQLQNMMPRSQNVMSPQQNDVRDYSAFNKPNYYSSVDDIDIKNEDVNSSDDKKNTMWKSWTNTEIEIKKNNDNSFNCHNRTFTPIPAYPTNYNRYSDHYPNQFTRIPTYVSHPYYNYPRLCVTH